METKLYSLQHWSINRFPLSSSAPLMFISFLCVLQISADLWLPRWLCLHHLWLVGPVWGHAARWVAAVGWGAAAQAGRVVLGWSGWRLLLQWSQWQHSTAAAEGGWGTAPLAFFSFSLHHRNILPGPRNILMGSLQLTPRTTHFTLLLKGWKFRWKLKGSCRLFCANQTFKFGPIQFFARMRPYPIFSMWPEPEQSGHFLSDVHDKLHYSEASIYLFIIKSKELQILAGGLRDDEKIIFLPISTIFVQNMKATEISYSVFSICVNNQNKWAKSGGFIFWRHECDVRYSSLGPRGSRPSNRPKVLEA